MYRTRYLIAFAVMLGSVLEVLDTSIVNVAIPDMMGNLGATLDEISWVSHRLHHRQRHRPAAHGLAVDRTSGGAAISPGR